MFNMNKKIGLIFGMAILVAIFFDFQIVFAQGNFGLSDIASKSGLSVAGDNLPTIIGNILVTALSFISVMFFILMIYGGFRWMFARGNEEETGKAQNLIFSAVTGMVIIFSSYALTKFVFKSIEKQDGSAEVGTSQSKDKTPAGDLWYIVDSEGFVCKESLKPISSLYYDTKEKCNEELSKIKYASSCAECCASSCPVEEECITNCLQGSGNNICQKQDNGRCLGPLEGPPLPPIE